VNETTGPKMVYRMGLGVRHSDQEWKRTQNKLIAENQGEIDKILDSYGVPLLGRTREPLGQKQDAVHRLTFGDLLDAAIFVE